MFYKYYNFYKYNSKSMLNASKLRLFIEYTHTHPHGFNFNLILLNNVKWINTSNLFFLNIIWKYLFKISLLISLLLFFVLYILKITPMFIINYLYADWWFCWISLFFTKKYKGKNIRKNEYTLPLQFKNPLYIIPKNNHNIILWHLFYIKHNWSSTIINIQYENIYKSNNKLDNFFIKNHWISNNINEFILTLPYTLFIVNFKIKHPQLLTTFYFNSIVAHTLGTLLQTKWFYKFSYLNKSIIHDENKYNWLSKLTFKPQLLHKYTDKCVHFNLLFENQNSLYYYNVSNWVVKQVIIPNTIETKNKNNFNLIKNNFNLIMKVNNISIVNNIIKYPKYGIFKFTFPYQLYTHANSLPLIAFNGSYKIFKNYIYI